MIHGIVVVGDSRRHMEEARRMQHFLRKEIGTEEVTIIRSAYLRSPQILKAIGGALARNTEKEPLLLYYAGHGGKGYWQPNQDEKVAYKQLVELLGSREFPVLFINDCCYAFSAAEYFQRADGAGAGLIAASSAEQKSHQGLLEDVLHAWRRGEVYQPKVLREQVNYGGVVRSFTGSPGHRIIKTITIHPRWRGVLDHLKYAFTDFFAMTWEAVIAVPETVKLRTRKILGCSCCRQQGEAVDSVEIQESMRCGEELDSYFFPAALAASEN